MKKTLLLFLTILSVTFGMIVDVTYKEYPANPLKPKAAIVLAEFEDLPKKAKDYVADEPLLQTPNNRNHPSCYYNETSYHEAISDKINETIRFNTDAEIVSEEHAEYKIVGEMYDQSLQTSTRRDENSGIMRADREAALATTFFLIEIKTGDTLFSKRIEMKTSCSATGANRFKAGAACKNPHLMHTELVDWVATALCSELFCIEKKSKIYLNKGRKEFKVATLAAMEGKWEEAVPVWERFTNDRKQKEDALFNLFQYSYYIEQNFSKAVSYMKELYNIKQRLNYNTFLVMAQTQLKNKELYDQMR